MRVPEFSTLSIPDTNDPSDPLFFLFAPFDPSARSMVITPLKTLDDLFGVLCVASRRPHAFSENNIRSLAQLARHVVFPIQRVRLEAMASTDGLTGLNNSRVFRRRLSDEVDRAIRYNHHIALIMIDIDHFKRVNDTLGHRAGDTILTQIGAILRRSSRTIDITARYGGEEMAILCPEATDTDAAQLAERVRSAVENTQFELPGGGYTRITISAGIAMLRVDRRTEAELIEAADQALYRAKATGRNRVCLSDGVRKVSV
jgi:diguanylate cyclase (GGDEF)-like protein